MTPSGLPTRRRQERSRADSEYPWPQTAVEYIVASRRQPRAKYDWMIDHLVARAGSESDGGRATLVSRLERGVRKCRQRGLLTKHPRIEPTPKLWRILVEGDMEDLLQRLENVDLKPPTESSANSEYPWPQTAVEYIVASRRRPRAKYDWMTEHLAAPGSKSGRPEASFVRQVRECRERGLLTKHPGIEPTWELWRVLVDGGLEDLLQKLEAIGLKPPTEVHFRLGLTIRCAGEQLPRAVAAKTDLAATAVGRLDSGSRPSQPISQGLPRDPKTAAAPPFRQTLRVALSAPMTSIGLVVLGAIVIALAWLATYPIVPETLESWRDFPLVYWVGMVIALAGASGLVLSSDARGQLIAVVTVGIVSVSPQLFFLAAGPDTVALLPLYRHVDVLENFSFVARRAIEVPGVALWARAIGDLAGLEPVAVLKIGLIVFAVIFFLGALWLARAYQIPAAAAAAILPVIAAFPVLNWQFAPQPLALAMMLVALALLAGRPCRSKLVCVYAISAFLVVSHQFVAIWLVSVLLVRFVIERRSVGRTADVARSAGGSLALRVAIVVAIVQGTYLIFVSSPELTSFLAALNDTTSVYRSDSELTSRQFGQYSSGGLSLAANHLLNLTKLFALVAMACAAGAMLAGGVRRRRDWRTSGVVYAGLMITGMLHMVVGLLLNVLGARGMNLVTLGAGFGARGLERDSRLGRITRLGARLAVVLFAFLVFRTQVENPNLLTPGTDTFLDRVGSHLAAGRPVDLSGETVYDLQIPWRVSFSQYERYNNVVPWQGRRTIEVSRNLCAIELAYRPEPTLEANLDLVADQGALRLYCQARNSSATPP